MSEDADGGMLLKLKQNVGPPDLGVPTGFCGKDDTAPSTLLSPVWKLKLKTNWAPLDARKDFELWPFFSSPAFELISNCAARAKRERASFF